MPPKKKTHINELRHLTKQQAAKQKQRDILADKQRKREETARWLIANGTCTSKFCAGAGICDWCITAGKWLRDEL